MRLVTSAIIYGSRKRNTTVFRHSLPRNTYYWNKPRIFQKLRRNLASTFFYRTQFTPIRHLSCYTHETQFTVKKQQQTRHDLLGPVESLPCVTGNTCLRQSQFKFESAYGQDKNIACSKFTTFTCPL